ncbi:DNA polymerase III subunit alpha [Vibrio alginolyticus]|uniref:DNA polymerase III subunit alpha n=1 Tax=Vibrio alginolyticus TaxID=663 RepID=UPI0006CA938D|nr:DNA polymerase III subunit alpha [Vibrio alginolyticus]
MTCQTALIRTHHSYHEGTGKTKEYIKKAVDSGIDTLIMADRVSFADGIDFYSAAKDAGINPVAGCLFSVADEYMLFESQYVANKKLYDSTLKVVQLLTSKNVSIDYLASKMIGVEGRVFQVLHTLANKSQKVLWGQYKDSLGIAVELLDTLEEVQLTESMTIFCELLSAAKTKKYLKLGPRGEMPEVSSNASVVFEIANLAILFQASKRLDHIGISNLKDFVKGDSESNIIADKAKLVAELLDDWTEWWPKAAKKKPSDTALNKQLLALNEDENAFTEEKRNAINWYLESHAQFKNFLTLTPSELYTDPECKTPVEELNSRLGIFALMAIQPEFSEFVPQKESSYSNLTLFAKDMVGLSNLYKLISLAYKYGQSSELVEITAEKRHMDSFPKLSTNLLKEYNTGLVAIIGLDGDELEKAIHAKASTDMALSYYKGIFSDDALLVGIEKSSTPASPHYKTAYEAHKNHVLIELAKKENLVPFALNSALFVDEKDYELHDNKLCGLLGLSSALLDRPKIGDYGNYLKTAEEMKTLFSEAPELIHNTEKLASYFGLTGQHFVLDLDNPKLPNFPIPEGLTIEEYTHKLAIDGCKKKVDQYYKVKFKVDSISAFDAEQKAEYENVWVEYVDRVKVECDIISDMGFCGYFLIVMEFIQWSKDNGCPVGPGRGSGAGSAVAYGLNITDIPPIEYALLFERFLNPERVSMPDFDVDFGAGFHPETGELVERDDVIQHCADLYDDPNSEFPSVGQIATHGMLGVKSGVQKYAKAFDLSGVFSSGISKLLPDDPSLNIEKALQEPTIQYRLSRESSFANLFDVTTKSEGLKQNSGVHAGGVVISPTTIVDYCPFQVDPRSPEKAIAQFDKNAVERGGLVKFDFLGLGTLTMMEYAKKYIKDYRGVVVEFADFDYADPKVFEFLGTGNSVGVFQLESNGMQNLLNRIKCENIEELCALIALFRPGPLQSGMVDNFIDRKHGLEEISYPDKDWQHESLKPILDPTYGIILYQEQVMQIAQVLAGYTLGGADMLRRAMGKKKPEEMAKQRAIFEEGAVNKGIDGELAMRIFDLVEKFAGYGFNKSHSMSYAYISYQTAWLKCYFPCEYLCALLTLSSDKVEKRVTLLHDAKKNGIQILPPDVNESELQFEPVSENQIRYGLGAIKGAREESVKAVIEERRANGPFTSMLDIKRRCEKLMDSATFKAFIMAGALDGVEPTLVIPEGALRTTDTLGVEAIRSAVLEDLERQFYAKSHQLKTTESKGQSLRKVVESLIVHYGKRYGVQVNPMDLADNKVLAQQAASMISKLNQLLLEVGDSGAIEADISAIRHELGNRSKVAKEYMAERDELSELKSQLEDQRELESNVAIDNSGNEILAFDKRSFLMKEEAALTKITVTTLKLLNEISKTLNELPPLVLSELLKLNEKGITSVQCKPLETEDCNDSLEDDWLNGVPDAEESFKQEYLDDGLDVKQEGETDKELPNGKKGKKEKVEKIVYLGEQAYEVYEQYGENKAFNSVLKVLAAMEYDGNIAFNDKYRLSKELDSLGYYVTGHPFDVDGMRRKMAKYFQNTPLSHLVAPELGNTTATEEEDKKIIEMAPSTRVAGIITEYRVTQIKNGKNEGKEMAIMKIDDSTGELDVVIFSGGFEKAKGVLGLGEPFAAEGKVLYDDHKEDGSMKIMPDKIFNPLNTDEVLYEQKRYPKKN